MAIVLRACESLVRSGDLYNYVYYLLYKNTFTYFLYLRLTSSIVGTLEASYLNFPITFLFVLSKYGEFSGYSPLSNLALSIQNLYTHLRFRLLMLDCLCR